MSERKDKSFVRYTDESGNFGDIGQTGKTTKERYWPFFDPNLPLYEQYEEMCNQEFLDTLTGK